MQETSDITTLAAHCNALRQDQGALRKRYRVDAPGEALVTDTATSVAKAGDSPMWGSVQIGTPGFDVTAPLAGRTSVLTLHSLSAREYEAWSRKTLDREGLVESTHRGFSELESLVGPDRIISKTIVTPDWGSRRASEKVTIADSVALGFLSSG